MTLQNSEHWDRIFATTKDEELGWYERDTSQTMKFLNKIENLKDKRIFLPGAGTSTLVKELIQKCSHLVLNDISETALNRLRDLYPDNETLMFLHHDVARSLPTSLPEIDIWIDRAVLHFLTDEVEINGYFQNLLNAVTESGHVLLAEFAEDGSKRCAGLSVHRYSIEEMSHRLGPDFELVDHEKYLFENPFGDIRRYNYAMFRKVN